MRCNLCHKFLKENTDGNERYCQGHDLIDRYNLEIINKKGSEYVLPTNSRPK